jgi:hypothetical protein
MIRNSFLSKKLLEHECMICGDHEMCDPNKINMCHGCNNGIMKIYIPINI